MHCYSTGTVGGSSESAGGFVWSFPFGALPADYQWCFWSVENNPGLLGSGNRTDPNLVEPGIIAQTTANMQTQFNYTGWHFQTETPGTAGVAWRMCVDGLHYPKLAWQYSRKGDFVCGDGVDANDLAELAGDWLTEGEALSADGNFDDKVNLADMAILSANWGSEFAYFDVVYDGVINLKDIAAIGEMWDDGEVGIDDLLLVAEYWLLDVY
jgi:hypothetical protein